MNSLFNASAFGRGSFMGASVEEAISVVSSIKGPLIAERKADAADFKLYSEASKRRIDTLDALARAEAALVAANKAWETSHRNEAELLAAQSAVDALGADLEQAKADVATYRALVDQHAAMIRELWRRADEAISSVPADRQAEVREILSVCAVNMGGRCMHGDVELGCKKCQKGKKRPIYDPFKAQRLGRVPMAGAKVGQFDIKPVVNVNPNFELNTPINVDLGGLPLSFGLFAGGALAFFVQGSLPKGWPKYAALTVGSALTAGGILNLAAQKPVPPPAPPPLVQPTSAQGKPAASEYQPAAENLLGQVSGRIVSPKDYDTVDIGPLTGSYPVSVELQNPTGSPIQFVLELVAQEEGVYGSAQQASHTSQVTVNPGAQTVDIRMPIVSGHVLDTVAVTLTAYKRRSAQDPTQMLDMKSFLVA